MSKRDHNGIILFSRTLRGVEDKFRKAIDDEFDGDVYKFFDEYRDNITTRGHFTIQRLAQVLEAAKNGDVNTIETFIGHHYGRNNVDAFLQDYIHDVARYSPSSVVLSWAMNQNMSENAWWDCIDGAASGGRVDFLKLMLDHPDNLIREEFGFIAARAATKANRIRVLEWVNDSGEMNIGIIYNMMIERAVRENKVEVLKFVVNKLKLQEINSSQQRSLLSSFICFSTKTWMSILDKGLYWMIQPLTEVYTQRANYGPDFERSCDYVAKLAGLDVENGDVCHDHVECLRALRAISYFKWNPDEATRARAAEFNIV